jgi:rubredoxin
MVMTAIEHEISDEQVVELLDEMYSDPVIVCGMPMQQSRILKELDEPAFNEFRNGIEQWECSECGNVYDEEDKAEECWKTCSNTVECDHCGTTLLSKDAQYIEDDDCYFCSDKCKKEYW